MWSGRVTDMQQPSDDVKPARNPRVTVRTNIRRVRRPDHIDSGTMAPFSWPGRNRRVARAADRECSADLRLSARRGWRPTDAEQGIAGAWTWFDWRFPLRL